MIVYRSRQSAQLPPDPCSPSFLVRRDRRKNGRIVISMAWPSTSSWLSPFVHSNQTQGMLRNTLATVYIHSLISLSCGHVKRTSCSYPLPGLIFVTYPTENATTNHHNYHHCIACAIGCIKPCALLIHCLPTAIDAKLTLYVH